MMPKAVYATFLLFPIIHQFHWTLLVLHKDEGKWIFYNSLSKGNRKDFYCDTTNNLRELIADYINSHSKSSGGKGIENTVHIEQCSPQQPDGFVECGVVVIFLMKQYLMNQKRSKAISIEECRKTRAEMILAFLSDQSKSSTSKVPQAVQKLKQIAESSKALIPQTKQYQLRRKQGEVVQEGQQFDIRGTVDEFKNSVNMYMFWKPGMEIHVSHLFRKQIPLYVLPEGYRRTRPQRLTSEQHQEKLSPENSERHLKRKRDSDAIPVKGESPEKRKFISPERQIIFTVHLGTL
ncbi:hypothetical protein RHGRI_023234 [Rhododendron griersonianum]|uniref:Ubiquitin-like protease family profile domain-containing protein n=1 Tax=Rhododendron griersonianum TaxID=479676 RepID=A0AAV6J4V3_9ERIC|nr:hypothetical protein RHGRI_023234 [Rhododendron griersonianum]